MMLQKQIMGGNIDKSMIEKLANLQENLDANQYLMEENSKSFQQKLEENQQHEIEEEKEKENYNENLKQPHLKNLNEDPLLNGKVTYSLTKPVTVVGRETGDIILRGIVMNAQHAKFTNSDGVIYLEPISQESIEFIHLNGEKVTGKI